eukprot:Mycagemm_TRINITY_DN9638_c0_g1::TRINITY_DN9638_c0_g1_i1::g.2539::m.2539 type:complete len:146 gc:universal TRINITY_DN9638_c0_g1_i1:604-167(-)
MPARLCKTSAFVTVGVSASVEKQLCEGHVFRAREGSRPAIHSIDWQSNGDQLCDELHSKGYVPRLLRHRYYGFPTAHEVEHRKGSPCPIIEVRPMQEKWISPTVNEHQRLRVEPKHKSVFQRCALTGIWLSNPDIVRDVWISAVL